MENTHKELSAAQLYNLVNAQLQESAVATLVTCSSDELDFHTMAVWELRALIQEAYTKGFEAGQQKCIDILRG